MKSQLLTQAEEVALFQALEAGDESARETIMRHNLALVASMARPYQLRMEFDDLMQEGTIGLLRAIEKYDWRRGAKFATVAHWWILQALETAIRETGTPIRLPQHMQEKSRKYHRAKRRLELSLGRDVTLGEAAKSADVTPEEATEIESLPIIAASLDAPIGEFETSSFADVIPDDAPSPFEEAYNATTSDKLAAILERLRPHERLVLTLRFGLDGGGVRKWREIGMAMGAKSHQAAQNAEKQAMAKLRRSAKFRDVRDMWSAA